jgi:hypothetical protein
MPSNPALNSRASGRPKSSRPYQPTQLTLRRWSICARSRRTRRSHRSRRNLRCLLQDIPSTHRLLRTELVQAARYSETIIPRLGISHHAPQSVAGFHFEGGRLRPTERYVLHQTQQRITSPEIVPSNYPRLPPVPQQIERLGQEHDIGIFAALGLLDANDLLRTVDMLDLRCGRRN